MIGKKTPERVEYPRLPYEEFAKETFTHPGGFVHPTWLPRLIVAVDPALRDRVLENPQGMTPTEALQSALDDVEQDVGFPVFEAWPKAEDVLAALPEGWALVDLSDQSALREAAREMGRLRVMRRRELAAQRQQGQGDGGDDGDVDEQDVVHGGAV